MEPIKIEQVINSDLIISQWDNTTITIEEIMAVGVDKTSIPELISALQKFYEDGK